MTDLDRAIDAYLDSQKATLWSRAYDLTDPDSRNEAARWLARVWAEVDAQLDEGVGE